MREQPYIGCGGRIGHHKALMAVQLDIKVILKVVMRGRPPARGTDPHIEVFIVLVGQRVLELYLRETRIDSRNVLGL